MNLEVTQTDLKKVSPEYRDVNMFILQIGICRVNKLEIPPYA